MPREIPAPVDSLWSLLAASAARWPDKPALVFYDAPLRYAALVREAEALAGWLQQDAGVQRGDRVLLLSQNCPQLVVANYAVFRADAVVVPVNAMWTAAEVADVVADSGAAVAVVAQELLPVLRPLLDAGTLRHAVVICYADALTAQTPLAIPPFVAAPRAPLDHPALVAWPAVQAAARRPAPHRATAGDLCVLPYTSGTTGRPKGCRHTHGTVQSANVAAVAWRGLRDSEVFLGLAPIFHMLGMQNGMHLPLMIGATVVMLPRWDRDAALDLIERYGVSCWAAPPAMLLDFFSNPAVAGRRLASLHLVHGGSAPMPDALAQRMKDGWGLDYNEGYGMTETASFLHGNPRHRAKRGTLGLPGPGVRSRLIDPASGADVPPGEVGEIVTRGPQVMLGYWRRPDADRESFVERDGHRWLRTGDLAVVDADGYYVMRDRLKRMITVSGYKVWPAEVENLLYGHPAVHEACVVGVGDERSGEAVRALVVCKPGAAPAEADFLAWCRAHMAVYKAPRSVRFVDALPKSNTGKILWRELQERENRGQPG
nr:long-chain-fatty-acid--CoA ligase [Piscinibacter sakaiensis]